MDKKTLKFKKERETKTTFVYEEVTDEAPVIGTLYIKKYVKPGDEVTVTIE